MKIVVVEYPKSGGTWLTNLVGDALKWPKCDLDVALHHGNIFFDLSHHPWYQGVNYFGLPATCVIKSHNLPDSPGITSLAARIVHLIRDGRDVTISKFFFEQDFCVKNGFAERLNIPARSLDEYVVKTAKEWRHFVSVWLEQSATIQCHYESLLNDPPTILATVIEKVGLQSDSTRILQSIEANTKEKMREALKETFQYNTFVRKGVAGDWRNYFSEENKRVFKDIAGDLLLQLGYERDLNW